MGRPVVRVLAVATGAAVALSGCGSIQERKERADRVIDSVERSLQAKTALIDVTQQVVLKLDDARLAAIRGQVGATATHLFALADFAHDRAAYVAPLRPGGAAEPVTIFAGTAVYQRKRTATAPAAPAAPKAPAAGAPRTVRPWVTFDLATIDPEDDIDNDDVEVADAAQRAQAFQSLNNPLFLLRLLRGALSGSISRVGAEKVHDIATTHYRFNIDRDKAVDDEDEDIQDVYETMFKSAFATGTVLPGEAWLDKDGLVHRFVVVLKSRLRRQKIADFKVTAELFNIGRPLTIPLPAKTETVRVDDLGTLVQASAEAPG